MRRPVESGQVIGTLTLAGGWIGREHVHHHEVIDAIPVDVGEIHPHGRHGNLPEGLRRDGFETLAAGVALYLSYGAPLLLAPCAAVGIVLVRERRLATITAMLAGVGVVVAAFTGAGFWLLDGLELTRAAYQSGISTRRPFSLFIWLNLGALTAMVGPMPLAGATTWFRRIRSRSEWNLLVGIVGAEVGTTPALLDELGTTAEELAIDVMLGPDGTVQWRLQGGPGEGVLEALVAETMAQFES